MRRGCVVGSGRQGITRPRPSGDAPRSTRGAAPIPPNRSSAARLKRLSGRQGRRGLDRSRSGSAAAALAPTSARQSCRFPAARGAPDRRATRVRSCAGSRRWTGDPTRGISPLLHPSIVHHQRLNANGRRDGTARPAAKRGRNQAQLDDAAEAAGAAAAIEQSRANMR